MIEDITVAIIRQAALLTKPQQDEFATKAAEAIATLINSSQTEIDDALVGQLMLPIGTLILEKLQPLI
ncbi:MAG: hypothetical protein Hens3KO_04170 [Henriciella sp.]